MVIEWIVAVIKLPCLTVGASQFVYPDRQEECPVLLLKFNFLCWDQFAQTLLLHNVM
jgi:hypothetical protein